LQKKIAGGEGAEKEVDQGEVLEVTRFKKGEQLASFRYTPKEK